MMNRMTAVSMILGVIAAGTAVADYSVGTVDVVRLTGHWNGWGGEFTIYDSTLSVEAYASSTSGKKIPGNSFQTFCLEAGETIYSGEKDLAASLGTAAVEGGVRGGSDPLSSEVAWLYTQFATGNLTGYDYTPGDGRVASAGALQRLIWSLEDEGGGAGWAMKEVDNPAYAGFEYVTLGEAQLALIGSWKTLYDQAVLAGWSGIGNVRVLNLERWNGTTYTLAQSQLYLVPVPGAVLLGSLGLAYAGLRLRRRCD
ncbi:MAG TPA: hypothetical protein PKN00_15440 [Sedimentisphaerales bacterium]|jgi:hypothetical protein|nr:hypothetical protein [Sedimentisphaerales bacterium]